ncbi:MAG: hypothetical protein KF791_05410 [Verrucomicrobiae bacterium]|nr:hypothetical protein [Verrucomicrobiae bacterium]
MIDPLLNARLAPLLRRLRWRRLGAGLAGCWAGVALAGLGLLALKRWAPGTAPYALPALGILAVAAFFWTVRHLRRTRPGINDVAGLIERRHPELKGVLLTAVQQEEDAPGRLNFLQQQVVLGALEASFRGRWRRCFPLWQVAGAQAAQIASLALLAVVLWVLRTPGDAASRGSTYAALADGRLEITPGDVALEKGDSLVVLARFGGEAPRQVELVVQTSGEVERRLPLIRSLSDPVFGVSIPDVSTDLRYRVVHDGRETREFTVTVFEHPRLERADADLNFPDYTGLEPRRIEDTRRISAVEGTRVDLTLQLNKPVVLAQLVERTNAAASLSLEVGTNRAVATLVAWPLMRSGRYQLVLTDADGRTNKAPVAFVFDALPNRIPEVKLTRPRGDQRPSALEEMPFEGTVWDDFGVLRFGLAYAVGGGGSVDVELGTAVPSKERRSFQHVVRLEDLQVSPGDLVTWHLWAEDLGPDGAVRITRSDLRFGEIRPFDEIFREGENMEGEGGDQGGGQTPATRLAELQKQIINATWRLQREPGSRDAYVADATVVRDSQQTALDQAQEEAADATGPEREGDWALVVRSMEDAVTRLTAALDSPELLANALTPEQTAYQALMRMQSREVTVTRGRNRGGGGGESASQRQVDQLDLKQSEDRYETQSQARTAQNPEQRAQLQILNRLQELARRQEDLNERLKELQAALEEARTEEEREEARRQLKRLQEEQREMLADVDELQQRMDRPENQSRLADERRRLEETRDEVQRAAEAAAEGATRQAVASGTRAQRQLESLRDDLRRQSASQFSEDVRQLRQEARELAQRQEDIARQLGEAREPGRRTLSETPERQDLARELEQQRERATRLVGEATEVAQLAEQAEPLLSQKLEETLRQFQQDDAGLAKQWQQELAERGQLSQRLYDRLQETSGEPGQILDMAAELLRLGNFAQADRVEARAREGIVQLRDGVERAAESVLGDEAEALRRAAGELDALTGELERELAGAGAGQEGEPGDPRGEPSARGAGGPGEPASEPARPGTPSLAQGPTPPPESGGPRPGDSPADGQGGGNPPGPPSPQRGQRGSQGGSSPFDLLAGGDDGGTGGGGPLTGGTFAPWSDRLREVEELVESPELRAGVAGARERARQMRVEMRRDLKKPDWAVVRLEILKPLVEVRQQIAEELARRSSREALVPMDRDPVPHRYTELVRRYYEELGRDR